MYNRRSRSPERRYGHASRSRSPIRRHGHSSCSRSRSPIRHSGYNRINTTSHILICIDKSASMRKRSNDGNSRISAVLKCCRQLVRDQLASIQSLGSSSSDGGEVAVSIHAFDDKATEVVRRRLISDAVIAELQSPGQPLRLHRDLVPRAPQRVASAR